MPPDSYTKAPNFRSISPRRQLGMGVDVLVLGQRIWVERSKKQAAGSRK